jgi:hypothetical protein
MKRTATVQRMSWLLIAPWLLGAHVAWAGSDAIVGDWRGSSVCTNRQIAPACADEQVRLVFTARSADRQIIHLEAQKLVATAYETMFEIDVQYSAIADEWSYAFETSRFKARWAFRVQSDRLAGTLTDQGSASQIRQVTATRWTTNQNQ